MFTSDSVFYFMIMSCDASLNKSRNKKVTETEKVAAEIA